jgi:hypothetical protein
MQEYFLPIHYDPGRRYTAAQLAVLLQEQAALLCWFAAESGADRCALGVDFEEYDAVAGLAPVQVIPAEYMPALLAVEDRAFRQAYRRSGRGQGLLVTYVWPDGKGWRLLPWSTAGLQVRHFPADAPPPAATL